MPHLIHVSYFCFLPFDSDLKANNVASPLYTSVNISKTWMYSYITRILLSHLTKLTVIPWYHQIPRPCKNSPIIPSPLSPFTVGLFYSGSGHCIWVLGFLSILHSQQTLPYCRPFWICTFAFLWNHLMCFHILYISCRVEATSRSLLDMDSDIWVRVHRTYWAPHTASIRKAHSRCFVPLSKITGVTWCHPAPSIAISPLVFPFSPFTYCFIYRLCYLNQLFQYELKMDIF